MLYTPFTSTQKITHENPALSAHSTKAQFQESSFSQTKAASLNFKV
jgi:hypothetical protein